jgi:hypothetical protein
LQNKKLASLLVTLRRKGRQEKKVLSGKRGRHSKISKLLMGKSAFGMMVRKEEHAERN